MDICTAYETLVDLDMFLEKEIVFREFLNASLLIRSSERVQQKFILRSYLVRFFFLPAIYSVTVFNSYRLSSLTIKIRKLVTSECFHISLTNCLVPGGS